MTDTTAFSETVQDGRTWINLTMQGRVGASRWRWYFDVQERNRNGVEDIDQFVARPGIGYALNQRSSVWVGYAYIATFQEGGGVIGENRTWQQYLWSGPAGSGTFSARSRVEQRFVEGTHKAVWRVRQQIRYQYPLPKNGSLAPIFWDEIFVQLNSITPTGRNFDQNRVFGGLGIRLNPKAAVEIGYMNQFLHGVTQDRMNHVLSGVVNITW